MKYAIKVVWKDGEEAYLRDAPEGVGGPITSVATFPSRRLAEAQVDFMKASMDGDGDVHSINIVRAPISAGARNNG